MKKIVLIIILLAITCKSEKLLYDVIGYAEPTGMAEADFVTQDNTNYEYVAYLDTISVVSGNSAPVHIQGIIFMIGKYIVKESDALLQNRKAVYQKEIAKIDTILSTKLKILNIKKVLR